MKSFVVALALVFTGIAANGACTFGHNLEGWYLHVGNAVLPYEKKLETVVAQAKQWIDSKKCQSEAADCEIGDHSKKGFGFYFHTRGGRSPYYKDMNSILADINLLKEVGLCR